MNYKILFLQRRDYLCFGCFRSFKVWHQHPKSEHNLPLYAPSGKFLLGDQTNT